MKMTKWQRKYIFVYLVFFIHPLCNSVTRAPDAVRDLLILLSSRRQREREETCQPASSHTECRAHAQTKHFQQSEIPTCVHALNR